MRVLCGRLKLILKWNLFEVTYRGVNDPGRRIASLDMQRRQHKRDNTSNIYDTISRPIGENN